MAHGVKALRAIGMFVANALTALLGTAAIDDGMAPLLARLFGFRTASARGLLTEDLIGASVAFGLGYFVYYRLQSQSAKWIGLAGAGWFALRVFHIIPGDQGTLLWEVTGGADSAPDIPTFSDWSGFTLVFVRTFSYSLGAICCASMRPSKSTPAVPDSTSNDI